MIDPRSENCKRFSMDSSGKITGVELGITEIPNAKYRVYSVSLIDENSANGQTVATCQVLDKRGISTGEQVRLTWAGTKPPFSNSGLSGSGNNVHVIVNGYKPPEIGPLALHVGGFNAPTSDIVYGLGLPFKHHVSFNVVFMEKSDTDIPMTPDPEVNDTFNYPFAGAEKLITQYFGESQLDYSPFKGHMGLDFGCPNGTSINSIAEGIVEWVDNDFYYGNYVRVYHPKYEICSFYAHLSETLIKAGDKVTASTLIARSGNSGEKTTGAHLHLEIRKMKSRYVYDINPSGYGNRGQIDPYAILKFMVKG